MYKGFDGSKKVKGVKRNFLVDTNGFLLSGFVSPANMHDKEGAKRVLGGIKFRMPKLSTIWADNGYAGDDLASYVSDYGFEIKVVKRTQRSFVVQPKRWIVERTFAWMDQYRRMSKDYERRPQTSEVLMYITMTRLMLRRLTKGKNF